MGQTFTSDNNITKYSFSELFDLNEIQKLQDLFSCATGVASIITDTNGTPITKPSNFCSLCEKIIKKTPKGLKNCLLSDSVIGISKEDGPRIGRCLSGGLLEGGASIIVDGKHIANWLIGQVLDENYKIEDLLSYADVIGVDRDVYKNELIKVKRMSKQQFENICNFLFLNAQQLSKYAIKNIYLTDEINKKIINELEIKSLNSELEKRVKQRTKQLEEANAMLEKEIINHQKSEKKINKLNKELENKVLERTYQLEKTITKLKETNAALKQEIIQRKNTENALKESERQFRHAVEEAPVPIMLYDEDGEVIKISRTWTDITGYTIKDITTTSQWRDIASVFKKDVQTTDAIRLFNLEKRQNNGEYLVTTKDGDLRIWDFYSAYIGKLQNERKLIMSVAIDITEKKRMEELQKSVEAEKRSLDEIKKYDRIKTEFFANISHELRTPINVIFSAVQTQELKLKEYLYIDKYIKIIKQNCYRLLRLVNNLIDITKIDSGYFYINKTNNNIISLVEDITLSVVDYIEDKGLSLIFDTNVEEKIISCDPEKIERIILNLLSNAVKFTPYGGNIIVKIEDGIEYVCIKVNDTGRGIPEDKQNSIFERFVQVDKSLARDYEGSGIGLSLVKSLVELHDGTISVKSKESYGTEFSIYIPCKLVDKNYEDIICCNAIGNSNIEKINIEFSDIYN